MTPRRAYIDKGERLQAAHGHSILIDTYFKSIASCAAPILVTTCGNDGEACEISRIFGNENVLVLRINKDGHDFSQDSRSWVVSPHLNLRDVWNFHGRQREYQSEIAAVARQWVEDRRASVDYAA
jgi:NAD kinase